MLRPAILGLLVASAVLPEALHAQNRAGLGLQRWTVEGTPTVLIGATTGEPEYLFTALRAAIQLSDGRIVALDATRNLALLRYYGPQGQFLGSAGRWGQGPFEFQYPIGLHRLAGDSVIVLSSDLRFSIFGPRGDGVSSGRLELQEPVVPSPSFLLSRSHLVVQVPARRSGMPETGVAREQVRYVSWDIAAKKATTMPEVQGVRSYYEREDGGVAIYPVPFSPLARAATSGGLLWLAQSDEARVRAYDAEGRLRGEIQLPLEAKRVGADDRRRYRSLLADMGERFARYAREVGFPDAFPVLSNLKADVDGNIWVQEYQPSWATEDEVWYVFDRTGRQIALVSLPQNVVGGCTELDPRACDHIFEIGADYMLIHRKDDLGVSRIARYHLVKESRQN